MSRERARELRRNQTDTEALLWAALRRNQLNGYRFKRQVPIGSYIVDFACLTEKLVIEVDGPGHDQTVGYDRKRTMFLEDNEYSVMRFSNEEVRRNLAGVVETIRLALTDRENS